MGFLSKIFGGKGKTETEAVLEDVLQEMIDKSGLDLSFDIKASPDGKEVLFDIYGADDELVTAKDGAVLNSIQLFLRRVLQNKQTEDKVKVIVDCNSFRENSDNSLLELAERLKGVCLKKKKPVYFRAFPPRERKIIHQYLSEDTSVKSKSVGDGLYKKIKVFPANMKPRKKGASNKQQTSNETVEQSPVS